MMERLVTKIYSTGSLTNKGFELGLLDLTIQQEFTNYCELQSWSCFMHLALLRNFSFLSRHCSARHPYFRRASRYPISRWTVCYVILVYPKLVCGCFAANLRNFLHKRLISSGGGGNNAANF